jgi:predicted NBD/HSP70 family sugar kinase
LLYTSIGIPGIVDELEGKHRLAPFMEPLKNMRIDTYMKEKYKIHTVCGNSVDFGAIGEKWKGAGQKYKNIIYVNYGIGLGSALILNGELYCGANGAAGEVGYMLPGMDFKRLRYDEEGTMEKLVAGLELERRIATETNQPYKTLKDLFECDSEEKLLGSNLISDIKNLIGLLLVNLVSVINPQVIILGGGIGKQLALRYTDYFEEFLSAHVPYVPLIVPTILDEKANLLGAVAYALSFIHKDYSSLNIMENSLGYN